MASANRASDLAASVSSKRSTKRPPPRRASSALSRAVRALPIWMRPVGDGAKRTTWPVMPRLCRTGPERATGTRIARSRARQVPATGHTDPSFSQAGQNAWTEHRSTLRTAQDKALMNKPYRHGRYPVAPGIWLVAASKEQSKRQARKREQPPAEHAAGQRLAGASGLRQSVTFRSRLQCRLFRPRARQPRPGPL